VVTIIYLVIALIAWQIMYRIERAAQLPSLASGSSRR
jgi:glutamate/aspartate transport system permease protein